MKEETEQVKTILELKEIGYSYEGRIDALSQVSLTVCAAERVALLGNNGAGKSTLFLNCNAVLRPHQGSIFLDGQAVTDKKQDLLALRRRVGIVFQDAERQFVGPTVEAEISFGPFNLGLDEEKVRARVDAVIKRLRLENLRTRQPHTLSGGEKKLLSIADILAMEADLMLLDEPTAALDQQNIDALESVLEDLHDGGMALMIATHDVDFAWRWAGRAIVMHEGKILADGAPEHIFSDEALLKTAGLKRPLLFELGRQLEASGRLDSVSAYPRRIEDLRLI